MPESTSPSKSVRLGILYCRCAYAKVVPDDVKDQVLRKLCASGRPFDTVADLCEMSARRDPALEKIAESGCVKIAACYERAVRGLFRAAGSDLPKENVEILNMREASADEIVAALLDDAPPVESAPTDPQEQLA